MKREMTRSSAALAFDPRTVLTRIENGKTTRAYRSKQVVFSQGDKADAVFFVESGTPRARSNGARNRQTFMAYLSTGSGFRL